ncbi:hypothetical protein [Lysobacter sp. CA196]|uniref:hypothetical protein n=1 Tax=Lysobacter sp. CA196 TaxID=3455606 RepID=UPI003F8D5B4D
MFTILLQTIAEAGQTGQLPDWMSRADRKLRRCNERGHFRISAQWPSAWRYRSDAQNIAENEVDEHIFKSNASPFAAGRGTAYTSPPLVKRV